jgi:hypothetical protein
MIAKSTRHSPVGAAFAWRVNDPLLEHTTATDFIVASLVRTVAMMMLPVLPLDGAMASEFVTTKDVAAEAKLTDPVALLIALPPVLSPVVPAAVTVLPK